MQPQNLQVPVLRFLLDAKLQLWALRRRPFLKVEF
jgi:hypothetical protein